jgi:nicotinamide-nucleotide adenylyltransferase
MMKGIFPGRFQPFTNAHIRKIQWIRKKFPQMHLIVVVGSGYSLSKQNPFTLSERMKMIHLGLQQKKIGNIDVIPVKAGEPQIWVKNLVHSVGPFDVAFSNNQFVIIPLSIAKYRTIRFPREKGIEGTILRSLLKNGKNIKSYVPSSVWKYIQTLDIQSRLTFLSNTEKYPLAKAKSRPHIPEWKFRSLHILKNEVDLTFYKFFLEETCFVIKSDSKRVISDFKNSFPTQHNKKERRYNSVTVFYLTKKPSRYFPKIEINCYSRSGGSIDVIFDRKKRMVLLYGPIHYGLLKSIIHALTSYYAKIDSFPSHAAGLNVDRTGILIIGKAGSGKTAGVLRLLQDGLVSAITTDDWGNLRFEKGKCCVTGLMTPLFR